nr:helix-turn-helix domain-containing protein [Nocardioides ungokensis]
MAGNSSTPGSSVTSRALALLLGAFDEQHRRLTLTELADRAGLPVATAHRLVAELVAWGALARTPTGEYVVGRRLWDVGLLAPVQTGLRQLASPYLHDLYAATLATVHLAVRDGVEVLYLDRLAGHASVPVVSQIGSRLPLHATGSARCCSPTPRPRCRPR